MSNHSPSFVRRYQIPLFFILAYAFTWIVWGSELAQQRGVLSFHIPDTFAYLGLGSAAFIVAGLAGGRAGMKDLVARMLRWRVGIQWYAVVVLLPIAVVLVTAGIYSLFGGAVPVGARMSLSAASAYFVYGTGLWLITEETAWRGFALPRLGAGRSALAAALILGVLWGFWHTPLFLMPTESGQSQMPYLGFLLLTIAESVLMAWVYNNTGGSVLLAALFHSASDAALAFTGVIYGGPLLFWVAVAVMWFVVGIVVFREGAVRLSRKIPTHQVLLAVPGYAATDVQE